MLDLCDVLGQTLSKGAWTWCFERSRGVLEMLGVLVGSGESFESRFSPRCF